MLLRRKRVCLGLETEVLFRASRPCPQQVWGKSLHNTVGSVCAHEDRTEAAWLEQAPGEGVQGIGTMLYLSYLSEISESMEFIPQACSFCHRFWQMLSMTYGLCSLTYNEGQNQVPSSLGLL